MPTITMNTEGEIVKGKIEEHRIIRWIIKVFCPGYHLAKDPVRKEKRVVDAVYPTHEE